MGVLVFSSDAKRKSWAMLAAGVGHERTNRHGTAQETMGLHGDRVCRVGGQRV